MKRIEVDRHQHPVFPERLAERAVAAATEGRRVLQHRADVFGAREDPGAAAEQRLAALGRVEYAVLVAQRVQATLRILLVAGVVLEIEELHLFSGYMCRGGQHRGRCLVVFIGHGGRLRGSVGPSGSSAGPHPYKLTIRQFLCPA
jgi:hypothetical protein